MGIPDHLTCRLKNLYAGQEVMVRTRHETTDWFQIRKGVRQGCILSSCLFSLYAEYIMWNARLDEAQGGIKIRRYEDDTTLMAESEELKSLLMKVKEEIEKVGLKLNIQKTKIMASDLINSWQIDGETMETVRDLIFGGSKITADGDCSHKIKRCLLLGRKAMTNLDSLLQSRAITLPTKVYLSQSYGFSSGHVCMWQLDSHTALCDPVGCSMPGFPVHYQLPELTQTHVHRVDDAIQLSHPLSSNQSILKEISPEYSLERLMLKLQYFGHLMQRTDSLEKTLMLGKIEGRRSGWQRSSQGMIDQCLFALIT